MKTLKKKKKERKNNEWKKKKTQKKLKKIQTPIFPSINTNPRLTPIAPPLVSMILLIDSYDSFTNNLAHLLKESTGQEVITIHNDSFKPNEYETFYTQYLPLFQFIVIGPGPGHPAIESDIGIISWLIKKFQQQHQENDNNVVPILGICLGFQSLCYEFGNDVSRLQKVKHGQVYDIYPVSKSELFPDDESPFGSVRYHSLYVENTNDEIIPLAYCYEPLETDSQDKQKQKQTNKILMAMKHKKFPFYGVQYHPESICSSKGSDLIKNFNDIAQQYNEKYRPNVFKQNKVSNWLDNHAVHEDYLIKDGKFISNEVHNIYFQKLQLDKEILPIDVCDYFYQQNSDHKCNFILLNSASIPGEWSIIGLPTIGESEIITHSVDDENHIYLSQFGSKTNEKQTLDGTDTVWNFIANKMQKAYISRETIKLKLNDYGKRELPFWGGYMGLISYEEGQHVIINKISNICQNGTTTTTTPDLKMVFITRFIAFDHVTKNWFIVAINDNDGTNWGQQMINDLHKVEKINLDNIPDSVNKLATKGDEDLIDFELPNRDIYKKQFNQCQEYLHSGDSYELCLTTQLKIHLPLYIQPWDIYKVLTLHKNPSPFSCFMDFDDCCLISSSPERFLSWKDDITLGNNNKIVQLRPIKGTVKNTDEITYEIATKILKTPKEMGENLMIVDLIRHDLYQFTDEVEVSQLMTVEEYKTVFQLVSVIQGKLYKEGYHGIDLLHRSLPPGSMTGAPKKRSVELLQDIESMQKNFVGGRRGIYSGVVGYWSITDDSDWSVIIRSVFHYSNDKENNPKTKLWRIGAGGAITVLSDVDDEWDEMMLKLTSALQAFK